MIHYLSTKERLISDMFSLYEESDCMIVGKPNSYNNMAISVGDFEYKIPHASISIGDFDYKALDHTCDESTYTDNEEDLHDNNWNLIALRMRKKSIW